MTEAEINELRARVVKAEDRARRAEERAAMLKIEVERLRSAVPAPSPGGAGTPAGTGDRFGAVKRAFARLYHPDRQSGGTLERALRGEVFNEFWPEIERIERES
ncbi:MAG: hypothetical protein R3F55_10425 [Alphaproteobacteria bacterium]